MGILYKIFNLKRKQLLVIGLVWPEPTSSAAGTRILQLIDLFINQDFEITFASAAQESEFSFDLTSRGIHKAGISLNSSDFDEFVKRLNPDVVLFDRYISEEQFGWRVMENCPEAIRILDTEDLHCLRLERQISVKKEEHFELDNLLVSEIAKREIASIYRCDLTLMISEFEMNILLELFRIDSALLHYLPIFYKTKPKEELLSYAERNGFVFIGNFIHEPNWDAVKQLKTKIWPQIKKQLPAAKLEVYGAYPSQKVLQLHNEKEGFIVHGRAKSAQEVIEKARVMLAPLRFGAGQKGKLLEAMQMGVCSVTTLIGAEGISQNHEWNGNVTDNFSEFSDSAVALYQNEELWKNKQNTGFELLKKFDVSLFENQFEKRITELQSQIIDHRKYNFIGNLLNQHYFQSTRFMSKWIEEKNKNLNQ